MGIGGLLITILQLYNFLVIARVILSWLPNVDYSNPLVRFLYEVTEPVLQPIREFMREQFPQTGMIDFSPLVLLVIIIILIQIISIAF